MARAVDTPVLGAEPRWRNVRLGAAGLAAPAALDGD